MSDYFIQKYELPQKSGIHWGIQHCRICHESIGVRGKLQIVTADKINFRKLNDICYTHMLLMWLITWTPQSTSFCIATWGVQFKNEPVILTWTVTELSKQEVLESFGRQPFNKELIVVTVLQLLGINDIESRTNALHYRYVQTLKHDIAHE